jgi:hypothetical protein
VLLSARTTNGSNAFFSGWSGGGCTGPTADCSVPFSSATAVTATFSPMTNNLIFITHDSFATTLGSAAAYDAKCNLAASAAGLNNATANGYIAFISSPTSLATARLGTARGWVRLDGRPFADTQTSIFTNQQIFNPVRFDETGQAPDEVTLSGTQSNGQLADSCSGWTSTAGNYAGGNPNYGPYYWDGIFSTTTGQAPCTLPNRVLCMGITRIAAVAPPVISGRKIWLSSTTFVPGSGGTPDQKCQAERAAGVTTAVAFLSTTTKAAASLLSPTTSYLRPDGTLVATGAQLASDSNLESGIWQTATGLYEHDFSTWTGSASVSALAPSACGNWTSTVGMANYGFPVAPDSSWWSSGTTPCTYAEQLYCLQTAP